LIKCPPRLGSQEYQQILEQGIPLLYTPQMVFMQDGAPCHRSHSTMGYLDKKKVCLLSDWPAQSPDMNIIENMWAELKKKIAKHTPISKNELWDVVQREWYAIPDDYVRTLYQSLPRRLHHVLMNKGLHSKY